MNTHHKYLALVSALVGLGLPGCPYALGNYTSVLIGVGSGPTNVQAADLNRDGKLDLVVGNGGRDGVCDPATCNVSILLGKPDGSFRAPVAFPAGTAPGSSAAVDFNRDGKLDLAVSNYSSSDISILLGNGNGSFQAPVNYPTGAGPAAAERLTAGDFNHDGKPDIAVANDGNTVSVLLGKPDGSLQAPVLYTVGAFPKQVQVGDLDDDGNPDLVVTNGESHDVSVLLGVGDGTFKPPGNFATGGAGPDGLAVADFDRDGKPDVAVGNVHSNHVAILLGKGDGSLLGPATYATGQYPDYIIASDINRDGMLDIISANAFGNSISILLGKGDGSFWPAYNHAVGQHPYGLALGDFNGDGRPDLAVANNESDNLSIFLSVPSHGN